MKINKILIANRGEIALRIMRSAKEMGISTVAVYSEADKLLPHVHYAEESIHIGNATASESYLNVEKIIDVCKTCKADAIHPGYGFLSENATFAERVNREGIIFIGPKPETIRLMGDKLTSKQTVKQYNVPLVPGMDEAINDIQYAKEIAKKIGFPIMIKASAGGGGKGIRLVENEKDLDKEMSRAMSEAKNAFGNDSVFIEKFIESPKHIEVQIMGDSHGNIVHFFERECSIQRRHQKVIEEAPSAVLSEEERAQIGLAATKVAKSCNYLGAGTVEFIVDKNMNFYFLEMNTRLQVEHPVTELITGVDLVKEQIRVAEGKALSLSQNDLKIRGHSIEVRVYAEDPENNFLPDVGKLINYIPPRGVGIRVDDGYEQGLDIPVYYDSMIAKLIVYAKDRNEAIARIKRAISEYQITGVKTTLPFCEFVFNHQAFIDGTFTTKFVEQFFDQSKLKKEVSNDLSEIAAIVAYQLHKDFFPNIPSTQKHKNIKKQWKNRFKKN